MLIYLVASELNNETLYKIGVTKRNINKRLNELKTGNPATLYVIHTFNSKYAPKIERHFHQSKQTKNIISRNAVAKLSIFKMIIEDNMGSDFLFLKKYKN